MTNSSTTSLNGLTTSFLWKVNQESLLQIGTHHYMFNDNLLIQWEGIVEIRLLSLDILQVYFYHFWETTLGPRSRPKERGECIEVRVRVSPENLLILAFSEVT